MCTSTFPRGSVKLPSRSWAHVLHFLIPPHRGRQVLGPCQGLGLKTGPLRQRLRKGPDQVHREGWRSLAILQSKWCFLLSGKVGGKRVRKKLGEGRREKALCKVGQHRDWEFYLCSQRKLGLILAWQKPRYLKLPDPGFLNCKTGVMKITSHGVSW